MNISKSLKKKILDSSDVHNQYKKQNKNLKKENLKLKKENSSLKTNLNNFESLIKVLIDEEDYNDDMYHYCPICGNVNKFGKFGYNPRQNVLCPDCRSLERHRFIFLVFKKKLNDVLSKPCKLLHFAPERSFYNFFKDNENIDYYPVDLNPGRYEKKGMAIRKTVNMEEIPYDDETFDMIYNSHVLEHVPDDFKAMGELYRVLKKDGVCVVVVPLLDILETYENDEYNTPELRLKYFGHPEHLRNYGHDFKKRLESVNFDVEEFTPKDLFEKEIMLEIFKIPESAKVFICRKK